MSDQIPPGPPAQGPDPFAELLKGLTEETAPTAASAPPAAAPAIPSAPVAPSAPVVPAAAAVSGVDQPTVAFTPGEQPTVAVAGPAATVPQPVPAPVPAPVAAPQPTAVLPGSSDRTAATTVLAGGSGGIPPQQPPSGGGSGGWDPRRKRLFIILIALAGVLLIALAVLLTILLTRPTATEPSDSPTPTSAITPSPTPSRTPTTTPTPTTTAVKPAVQSFTVTPSVATCTTTDATTSFTMHFAWTVVGSPTQIAIASSPNGTVDAVANPFQNGLPATATDFQMPFSCENAQLTYTLTIQGPDGNKYSGVVTVTRDYQQPAPPAPVIEAGDVYWNDGEDYATCQDFDNDQPVGKEVVWTIDAQQANVDVYVAQTENAYPDDAANWTLVEGGLNASGVAFLNLNCGHSGYATYFGAKIVVQNASGTAEYILNGNFAT